MSTAKVLQTPEILEIIGSTIRIKHPDISGNTRTSLISDTSIAGTSLSIADNNNFSDNDWFLLGDIGNESTEECDINGAVTRGTSLTITNSTKFNHTINQPVTKIMERGITIYGATTDGGVGTIIESVDAIATPIANAVSIQWDKEYTEYTLISTDTSYAYYYVVFTDGVTTSSSSDYVASSGLASNSVGKLIESGLNMANASIDNEMITREWLLTVINDWQDEYTNYTDSYGIFKDWSFEVFEDKTSISGTILENTYPLSGFSSTLKYNNSERGILNLKFGNGTLDFVDLVYFEKEYIDSSKRTNSNGGAVIGATSIVLDDSGEFASSGNIKVGSQTITYTTNTKSTNTLSGIPASGTGSITATINDNDPIWQGVNPGLPDKYTVFNNNIILNTPVSSDYIYYKFKIKGLKELDRLTSFSNNVSVLYTYSAKLYIAYRVEQRKGNTSESELLYTKFRQILDNDAQRDPLQTSEETVYYTFSNDEF